MVSIITAVHNGLSFNKIYLQSLRQYTSGEYEIIIIDNASADGSREFFQDNGCIVIANKENYSYPYCQNQGIEKASGDYLFFLNNDLVVSPSWNERLIEAALRHDVDIISAAGIENLGNAKATQSISRKWKRIKNLLLALGTGESNLRLMHRLMYGNWEKFCEQRFARFGYDVIEGIVGNNVMMTRKAISLIDGWDERIQAADWDLFMRIKQRSLEAGDIKPCHIALGVYIHHYIRMTVKYAVKPAPFADMDRLINLREKWTEEQIRRFHPDNTVS